MAMFTVIDNLRISTSDRISIFGRTGSGKTFFAKNYLLPQYDSYIFWDVKRENVDIEHDIEIHTPSELRREITSHKKILYQPITPTDNDFNEVCEVVFNTGNTCLYVDEAAAITMPGKIQYWHKLLITQGRSYNAGIINVSQRPRDIHNTLISESEHLFVFALSLETDILKLRQQMGDAADEIRYLPEYHFLYYSVRTNRSYIFKPVRLLGVEEEERHIISKLLGREEEKELEPEKPKPHKLERYIPKLEDYISLKVQRES